MLTNLFTWIRRRTASAWHALSQLPPGFFKPREAGWLSSPAEALTLSAFYAGVRKYQTACGSLPLVVYRKDGKGGRERAGELPVSKILGQRPNPAQSRAVMFEYAVKEMILGKGFFCHVQKNGAGYLTGLFPIPSASVLRVIVDSEWNKLYVVRTETGVETYTDREMVHVFWFSLDGITGCSLMDYAGESLGLHKQIQKSAGTYFANAVRPSGYLKFPGKLNEDAVNDIKTHFKAEYAGADNRGKLPVVMHNGSFEPLPNTTAEDAKIIEAFLASVPDIGRWLSLSPLQLGDLSRGTYSNLGADNTAFYQSALRPLLDKIELELNWKIFGPDSPLFCEFLVAELLRGDPLQQAQVADIGIKNGSVTRAEQREWLNLPPKDGLDVPLVPLNMGPPSAAAGDAPTDAANRPPANLAA